MGSTFSSLRVHLVFSTKERRPFIAPQWRLRLHEYLGGSVRDLKCVPEAIGGMADHVHLLVSYRPTLTISDFVRELKKAASVWSCEQREPRFGWQDGYAAFSVSGSQKNRVVAYVLKQEEHHRTTTYREELENLLRRHGIQFNPEYLE